MRVVAEDRSDVAVNGKARVSSDVEPTTIDSIESRIVIRIPERTDLVIGATSARVEIEGRVGDVAVVTDSGSVTVEHADSIDARTNSGRIDVKRVENDCCVRTTSARVEVGGCGNADVATESGRIALKGVNGSVRAHCVSGRVEVEMESAHDVEAETVSGRIDVSLPPGVQVHRPSGPADDAPVPDGCDCTVNARSVSGRVNVRSR